MNLKARVENLEKGAGVGYDVKDIFAVGVPAPKDDPDGSIVAAGIQRIEYCRNYLEPKTYRQWIRQDNETGDELKARAISEAPPAPEGAFARWFWADYRGSEETASGQSAIEGAS